MSLRIETYSVYGYVYPLAAIVTTDILFCRALMPWRVVFRIDCREQISKFRSCGMQESKGCQPNGAGESLALL